MLVSLGFFFESSNIKQVLPVTPSCIQKDRSLLLKCNILCFLMTCSVLMLLLDILHKIWPFNINQWKYSIIPTLPYFSVYSWFEIVTLPLIYPPSCSKLVIEALIYANSIILNNVVSLFHSLSLSLSIYIYIYIHVCVCVCITYTKFGLVCHKARRWELNSQQTSLLVTILKQSIQKTLFLIFF